MSDKSTEPGNIELIGLSKRFGRSTAVENVDLRIPASSYCCLLGPSGCGKSTLFNIIGGLINDHDGEVLIDDRPVDGAHKDVGVVFQEESTFPWRTTLDNVGFPLEVEGVEKAERQETARKFIKLVGLEGFENHYPA